MILASAGSGVGRGPPDRVFTRSASTSPTISTAEAPLPSARWPPGALGDTGWPEEKDALPPANRAVPPTWPEVVLAVAPLPVDWLPCSVA